MRFTETRGHKVVSTATASTVGRLDNFIIDPAAQQVVGLSLKKTSGAGDTLPWNDIASFGTDAVTVTDADLVVVADPRVQELAQKRHAISGKRVLSQSGVDLGKVVDVDFDPTDGTVRAVLTDREEILGSRLTAIGSYAVVVRSPGSTTVSQTATEEIPADHTKAELLEEARVQHIKGRSSMTKAELEQAVEH